MDRTTQLGVDLGLAQATAPELTPSTTPEPSAPKRTRRFKKRVRFQPPKPAIAVKALWEQASAEEREKAHRTCVLMLEYWLGHKSKSEMVSALALPPLRVWQLSQAALSGMLAGLLKQPKMRKRGRPPSAESDELAAARKEIAALRRENEALRTVNEILKDLPLNRVTKSPTPPKAPEAAGGKKAEPRRVRRANPSSDRGAPAEGGPTPTSGTGSPG